MKQRTLFFPLVVLVFAWAGSPEVKAAAAATNVAPPTTNAALPEIEIPRSVFKVPNDEREGRRDPFFPRSTRVFTSTLPIVNSPTNTPVAPVAELKIDGISFAGKPLVIINGENFGVGDERDVTSRNRKYRVRCLEINSEAKTVVVSVGGQRQTLRFTGK